MASCEMCGKNATTRARIEGVVMSVCASCATYGTELTAPKSVGRAPTIFAPRAPQGLGAVELELPIDFAKRLRKARQAKGLTEEDAARALAMTKTAFLHYESGKHTPDDATAKKLARFFSFSLAEKP